jgi:hypothetical protein
MSTEHGTALIAFIDAMASGQPDAMAHTTRAAYAAGADFCDLMAAVEQVRMRNGISSLMVDKACVTVSAWQWIADRRRALA